MDDNNIDEAVLSIAQRQKRAMIMRRYQAKIERSREMAKKRIAPKENIKKRAYAQARQIVRRKVAGKRGAEYEKLGPSEKMAIDRAVEGKQKLIKKIALRLIPRVKAAEQQRLSTFMKGQAIKNHGQPEGKTKESSKQPVESSGSSSVKEEFNSLFSEQFPPMAERSERKQPEEKTNTFVKKSGGKELKGNKNIIQYSKFEEECECNSAVYKAIAKKARNSKISEDILGEVYNRGMEAWYEETGVTQQQYAFARVNSFINQGKSYFNEDADLHEMGGDQHYGDAKGAFSKGARGTPITPEKMKKDTTKTLNQMFQKSMKKEETEIEEGRAPGTPSIKRYTRNDGTTALKSLNKWGKRKDWRDTEGGLAKAKEHAGVDKITEEREVELHDGGPSRNIKKATLIGNHKTQKDHVIIRTHDYLGKPKDLVIHKDWIKEEVQQTNENFIDGKGPGKPGDSARHGLKGKSAAELKKIRSSETASPRTKQLAHWLLNMHHNESVDESLKDAEDNPCWDGYKPVGTKKKAGKTVPNCVPEETQSIVPQSPNKLSKRRMGIQSVERDSTPATPSNDADHPTSPVSSHNKQAQIKKKIIDEAGNSQNDPKKRLQGTDSLVKAYKKDTPGECSESLNESFNIAFASGVGVTLTAGDLGMKTMGGFALHPSVIEEMKRRAHEEVEEEVRTADKAPVVIPAHKDANGNTIPAKTVMRKKDKTIIKTGNVHDGEAE